MTPYYPLFRDLLPTLTDDERAALTDSIRQDGLQHPIIVLTTQPSAIVDGWHRFQICQELGITPQFESRDMTPRQAKAYAIRAHIGRRNLNTYQRARLALMLKPDIAKKARAQMRDGIPDDGQPINTNAELATLAGTSADTVCKVVHIEDYAPPYVKEGLDSQDLSIHRAYQLTRTLKDAGYITKAIAGKYTIDDPKLIDEIKRGELAQSEWVEELYLSGHVSVAESDETVSIDQGAIAIMKTVRKRADEHVRQARMSRVLLNRPGSFVLGDGNLVITLEPSELDTLKSSGITRVMVTLTIPTEFEPLVSR
jgi:hypothetical protein